MKRGLTVLAIAAAIFLAAMFLVGLTSGIELGRKSASQQIASSDAVIALAIPDNVPVDRR